MTMTRLVRLLALVVAALALTVGALAIPAQATTTGAVKGVVTNAGVPQAGLKVELLRYTGYIDPDWEFNYYRDYSSIATDFTNAHGSYSFSGLKVKKDHFYYAVKVTAPDGSIVMAKERFTPKVGPAVTRNVSVHDAAIITGSITRADTASPTSITALLDYDTDFGVDTEFDQVVPVAADGSYRFVGVPAIADNDVRFVDASGTYVDQCYDNDVVTSVYRSCDLAGNDHFATTAGETTNLTAQVMSHPGASLSGTVTDTSGHPLKGIDFQAVPSDGPGFQWHSPSHTSGEFKVSSLPVGAWKLRITDPQKLWAGEWYDNTTETPAHVFNLIEGQTVGSLEIALKSRPDIKATVVPGNDRATFNITVTRKATGSKPSGTVTVTCGAITKSATLMSGKATITLTGLTAGLRTFEVSYSGTSSTASGTTIVHGNIT